MLIGRCSSPASEETAKASQRETVPFRVRSSGLSTIFGKSSNKNPPNMPSAYTSTQKTRMPSKCAHGCLNVDVDGAICQVGASGSLQKRRFPTVPGCYFGYQRVGAGCIEVHQCVRVPGCAYLGFATGGGKNKAPPMGGALQITRKLTGGNLPADTSRRWSKWCTTKRWARTNWPPIPQGQSWHRQQAAADDPLRCLRRL